MASCRRLYNVIKYNFFYRLDENDDIHEVKRQIYSYYSY